MAVGIIHNHLGEVLIAERPQHKYKGGLWEFPGGKVEPHETVFQALQRELYEELNIQVMTAENWLTCEYDYSDREVLLDVWKVTTFSGNPQGKERQRICWVHPKNFTQFTFPEGNRFILDRLIS